jgi:hypothetical protein
VKWLALLCLASACGTNGSDIIDAIIPKHIYTCSAMQYCEDEQGLVTASVVTERVCVRRGEAWQAAWGRMDAEHPSCGHVQMGRCSTQMLDVCAW